MQKLVLALILSASHLGCVVFAEDTIMPETDFSSFNIAEAKPIKLINPIYLNTDTKPEVKVHTIIPNKLRSFSESEYFTSSIDEEEKPSIQQKASDKENPIENQEFVPNSQASDFFAPVGGTETISENDAENSSNIDFDSTYSASVDTQNNYDDIDLEGRPVSGIQIKGLNSVKPEIVLKQIKTQVGSTFNSDLLQKDLQQIYATGFFTDNMTIEPTLRLDGTVGLAFVLEENISVTDISIIGNSVISSTELIPLISSLKGKPQNLNEINLAIDKINGHYREKGYILANVNSVDDDELGVLRFSIKEGIINKINISGNEKTKDYVIERNIMTQPKTVYNEEYLKRDLAKVYSTQVFEEVNREIKPCEDGTYDVTIAVKEKSNDSISLGGGLDSGLGVFGSIGLKDNNFLGRAQRVSISGMIGSGVLLSDASIKEHMNYNLELSFFEPYFLNADNSLSSRIYLRELGSWGVPLAIERRVGMMSGIEHKVKGYKHLSTTFDAGVEHIHLKEGDYNRISALYAQNGLDISRRAKQLTGGLFFNFAPGIKYSTLDNEEVPRDGVIARAMFNEAVGVSDFSHTNGRLSGMVTKFFPVFKKSSFSLTAKAGIKVHGDDMPEVMAYRLGGPYSIRGFKMNGVGAGDSFFMGSAELATPLPFSDRFKWDIIKKTRLTFFVDAGKVFDPTISSTLYDRPLSAISAGIGLRVFVPGIGPISVDYGVPLTHTGRFGSSHGYFTFGTGGMNMYNY